MEVHFGPSELESFVSKRYSQKTYPSLEYPLVACNLFLARIGSAFRSPNKCTQKCIEK